MATSSVFNNTWDSRRQRYNLKGCLSTIRLEGSFEEMFSRWLSTQSLFIDILNVVPVLTSLAFWSFSSQSPSDHGVCHLTQKAVHRPVL
jgi:hypothetical protein